MEQLPTESSNPTRFPHFMLKEIYEQPETVRRMLRHWIDGSGRFTAPEGLPTPKELLRLSKITIAASGSSRHAGLIGKFMLERLAGVMVEVDFASQYCYRDPVVWPDEMTILISQSGTTVDTLAALQEARRKGSKSLAICNVAGSPLTRDSDATLLTYAGKEVAIAATKSFMAQITALLLLSIYIAQCRGASTEAIAGLQESLKELPGHMESVLLMDHGCRALAQRFVRSQNFLVAGRNIEYPVALEGALKLKETSYIQAEGLPTGELKHGPAALITEHLPMIILATRHKNGSSSLAQYERTVSNIREFTNRGIPVVALVTEGDAEIAGSIPDVLAMPSVDELLQPMLAVIPLQLFAYHSGVARGNDVDQPRNLSKSVLVE
jgi:glucosamine--fructose-6-phosphate aminotransferase (isomerizing)